MSMKIFDEMRVGINMLPSKPGEEDQSDLQNYDF